MESCTQGIQERWPLVQHHSSRGNRIERGIQDWEACVHGQAGAEEATEGGDWLCPQRNRQECMSLMDRIWKGGGQEGDGRQGGLELRGTPEEGAWPGGGAFLLQR